MPTLKNLDAVRLWTLSNPFHAHPNTTFGCARGCTSVPDAVTRALPIFLPSTRLWQPYPHACIHCSQFLGCLHAHSAKMQPTATDAALSVCLSVCMSVHWTQPCTLQKRLNWLMCHLGCRLACAQGTMRWMGPISPTGRSIWGDISRSIVKYSSCGQYSQLYSLGACSDVASRCQNCSNLF